LCTEAVEKAAEERAVKVGRVRILSPTHTLSGQDFSTHTVSGNDCPQKYVSGQDMGLGEDLIVEIVDPALLRGRCGQRLQIVIL